jgi:serine protease Do
MRHGARVVGVVVTLCLGGVPPARGAGDPAPLDIVAVSDSLRELAARVGPAVVEIATTGFTPVHSPGAGALARRRGTGSGVILTGDGYIVTNAHVVQGARRVRVLVPRPRSDDPGSILPPRGEVKGAVVVGWDQETDLAVLKVDATGLPLLELADSDDLRQGEVVLAFGSPLGLEQSVTFGVVSSVARQLTPEAAMIYIQTDAPINPGNSGGALVDSRGRLVGINTLIASQSGGSEGVGFAAPSNIVRAVFEQIRETGRVRRGEIGLRTQTITPPIARGLGLPRDHGVLVRDVVAGSPADRVGLRLGDVVVSLDGKPMENARQLEVNLYRRRVGAGVPLEVLRGGRTLRFVPIVAERPGDPASIAPLVTPARNLVPRLGVLALDLDARVLALMPGLRARAGVVVAAGTVDAPFEGDTLQPGDVIYGLNGDLIPTVKELRTRLRALEPGAAAVLLVERDAELRYVVVELDEAAPGEASEGQGSPGAGD